MCFGDNLRTIRKEKGISQEDLAGLLNVSRQAVSKWEQNNGYPEMEKVIQLAEAFNISLDYLILGRREEKKINNRTSVPSGRIMIKSHDGKQLINCYKVLSKRVSAFKKAADIPQYVLYGVDSQSFWGESKTLLGWYADEKNIQKEIQQILDAIKDGVISYELQYAAPVRETPFSVKLINLLKIE